MKSKLPWSSCDNEWNSPQCVMRTNFTYNCSVFLQEQNNSNMKNFLKQNKLILFLKQVLQNRQAKNTFINMF
jgi:hypothetical protein